MKMHYLNIQNAIYSQIDDLYLETVLYQDMWMRKVAQRELSLSRNDYLNGKGIRYQLRVEFSESTFVIRWISCTFIHNSNRAVRVTKSIAIPRNGKYTKPQFKHASEWELDLILEVEKYLAPIRHQLKHIMKMHFALGNAFQTNGDKLIPLKIKDKVTPTTVSIKYYKKKLR